MKTYIDVISMNAQRISVLIFILMLSGSLTYAQGDGPRFYWKGLMGTNAIPMIGSSMGGNANPLDRSNLVIPGSNFESTTSMVGYAKMLPFGKRSGMVSLIVPMGRLSGEVTLNGVDFSSTARGFGDPMLQAGINVIGPKAIMNIPDMLRYKPGFSVDIIGSLAIPIGNYNSESPINIGQNRWYGRIGTPIVWQLGSWIPGKRTTFEVLPAVWFFSDNTDFMGTTISTEAMYQIEAHLTRDFMERAWGSLNFVSYSGGKATVDGKEGSSLNNIGVGATIGYEITDNLQLNVSYTATVNDKNAEDLKIDSFRMTLLYGWHPLVEGMKRLNEH